MCAPGALDLQHSPLKLKTLAKVDANPLHGRLVMVAIAPARCQRPEEFCNLAELSQYLEEGANGPWLLHKLGWKAGLDSEVVGSWSVDLGEANSAVAH